MGRNKRNKKREEITFLSFEYKKKLSLVVRIPLDITVHIPLGVKRPRREADHSPPSSVEVKE
jgi:hypothetical protein